MLREKRNDANPGGVNVSWFAGGDYVYERMLRFPEDLPGYIAGDQVVIEFEGVYHHAKVLLNGKQVAERPSGYFGIYADLTEALCPGENTLTVLANNREQPNSRWYTGSGIYRPVTVHLLPQKHVLLNGIRVTTLDINQPTVQLQVDTNTGGRTACGDAGRRRRSGAVFRTGADQRQGCHHLAHARRKAVESR